MHHYQGRYHHQPNLKQGAIFLCGHLIEASVASRRQSLQRQHGILALLYVDEFIGQKLFTQSLQQEESLTVYCYQEKVK